jgi:glutamine synthetase
MTVLSPADIVARVEQSHIQFINLQFTDLMGAVKSITIPAQHLAEAFERGLWFDGSSVEGFARIAESDMYLMPDPATFAILPWLTGAEATGRLLCNVHTPTGQVFDGDARMVLSRVLEDAAQLGFTYNTGPELEFFLLKRHADGSLLPLVPQDETSYFDSPTEQASSLWRQMTATLSAFGITVEAMHAEVSGGQHEIDFQYSDALNTADNAVTFRFVLKVLAQQANLHATFLPKPLRGINGSGMHVHQSLFYKANGSNAFVDPGDVYGLSTIAKHFIAGQLAHARGMCAILAPLVNSYKRLVPGYEAPVYVSWGRINRSALIRVPRASRPESTRIELRCPDPSCNPYLAFAVMLAAGLDGIRRELPAPEATNENLYLATERRAAMESLPASLKEALDELEKDEVIGKALGPHVLERFLHAKRLEWADYQLEVTPWEWNKYLPIF